MLLRRTVAAALLLAAIEAYATARPFRARPRAVSNEAVAADGDSGFSLDSVRGSLIRQEETIIFALIERVQFAANAAIYDRGGTAFDAERLHPKLSGRDISFLEMMLFETEQVHARARRYLSPEEYAFFPDDVARPAIARAPGGNPPRLRETRLLRAQP